MTVSIASDPQPITAVPQRRLAEVQGASPGPTLIAIGGLHGNEPAGVTAIQRVARRLEELHPPLGGTFLGLVGNRPALAAGRRYLSQDLNRIWSQQQLAIIAAEGPSDSEERELVEIRQAIDRALGRATRQVYVLDLHTTSGPGPAFAVLDDTLPNRDFAFHLPVPVVLGIEEELDGTLASHLLTRGVIAIGFECGIHQDPGSIARGEAALWIALEASGLLAPGSVPEVAAARRQLAQTTDGLPRLVETRFRYPVATGEQFRIGEGLVSFKPLRAGEVVATNQDGPIRSPEGGRILMPLYQTQGNDGFFIVRDVQPFWLRLSTRLRRLRAERFLHWLPGVRRKEGRSDTFVVDLEVARWYAVEILHLLGFRRHGPPGRFLEVSRREPSAD